MRTLLIVVVGLTLIPTQDNAAKKDLAAMEGTWTLVGMEVDGMEVPADKLQGATLTIRGNKANDAEFAGEMAGIQTKYAADLGSLGAG